MKQLFWLTKRQQLVGITIILVIGLIATQLASSEWRFLLVGVLSLLAYLLSAFGLREDLRGVEWLTLLILPTAFTAAFALFYFLLPSRWLTRIPIALVYGIGMYALLLTENIYNVAASRTIALLRVAHSVGFILTLLTYFLLLQTIYAFRTYPIVNVVLVGLLTTPLLIQSLWAMELENRITQPVKLLTIIGVLILGEITWVLSLWPAKSTIIALVLTTMFYSITGMAQQFLATKLYKKTIIEFAFVSVIVFIVLFISTSWRPGI